MKDTINKDAIIIDIDGTLMNINHRRRETPDGKFDWDYFNNISHIARDRPNNWCVEILKRFIHSYMADYEDPNLIFVSGRKEKLRDITLSQIKNAINGTEDDGVQLFMRKDGDNRKDSIVKSEIYHEHIKDKYNVLFVIDDRQQVVDMWRELGLTALQCDKGDF